MMKKEEKIVEGEDQEITVRDDGVDDNNYCFVDDHKKICHQPN